MQPDEDLRCLDALIAGLGHSQDGAPGDLLQEHLRAARRYLLAATRDEYRFSLQHALESLFVISDKAARMETKTILQRLLGLEAPKPRRSGAVGTVGAFTNPVRVAPAL